MMPSKREIRILYTCPFAHHEGHYPLATVNESLALAKAGFKVFLCTFRGVAFKGVSIPLTSRRVCSGRFGTLVSSLTRVLNSWRITKPIGLAIEYLSTLIFAALLENALKYDVIYLRDGELSFLVLPFLNLFFKRKWIITVIGSFSTSLPYRLIYHLVTIPLWKSFYLKHLHKLDFLIVAHNRYLETFFVRNLFKFEVLSQRVRVVPLGVEGIKNYVPQDEARRRLNLPLNIPIFLHFGVLHPGKDIKTVLAAFEEIPNAILVLAGRNLKYFEAKVINLKNLIVRHKLQEKVVLRDFYIPEEDKKYYFAAADAVILSYRREFLFTASVLFEAARFRVPVIASDNAELGELVKKYRLGLIFKAQNPSSLKDTIVRFCNLNQSEKEAFRKNCEKFVWIFSIENWALQHKEIFLNLLAETK